ncbi:MAG: PfkB family carbohydrate kinase, partial [Actinomycetota bacterium]|nr:PfkB family carbohydrate kinase [Actinomycetota bacterium]
MPPVNLTNVDGVSLDALTIGNALVDVLATVDEGFLVRENIVKGSMNLVDIKRSKHLHSLVNSRTEMSGGSAANTAYGLASLGGKAGFIGKISADRLGESFSHDLETVGVKFFPGVTCETEDTGRCLIVVTPDGNRTM